MRNTKYVYNLRFLGSCSVKSLRAVSVHTLNIPCLLTANDFSRIKQAFTEYCLKHTRGSIVWTQPTSGSDFGRYTRPSRAFIRNDATDFVTYDRKWCNGHCKCIKWGSIQRLYSKSDVAVVLCVRRATFLLNLDDDWKLQAGCKLIEEAAWAINQISCGVYVDLSWT